MDRPLRLLVGTNLEGRAELRLSGGSTQDGRAQWKDSLRGTGRSEEVRSDSVEYWRDEIGWTGRAHLLRDGGTTLWRRDERARRRRRWIGAAAFRRNGALRVSLERAVDSFGRDGGRLGWPVRCEVGRAVGTGLPVEPSRRNGSSRSSSGGSAQRGFAVSAERFDVLVGSGRARRTKPKEAGAVLTERTDAPSWLSCWRGGVGPARSDEADPESRKGGLLF
jgi:hypothetical protein